MQQYDSEKAARVWQRVRGDGPAQDLPELPALAAEESAYITGQVLSVDGGMAM